MALTTELLQEFAANLTMEELLHLLTVPGAAAASQRQPNLTDLQWVERQLGPQHNALHIVVPLTVFFVMVFVTGVIGNVITCVVIASNGHMRTATNYYLCSLALSDLLSLLFGMPQEIYVLWQQYPWVFGSFLCSARSLVSEMTTNASVLTITAFTIERYFAICRPLWAHTVFSLSRVCRIIVAIWVLALLSAIPFTYFTKVNYVRNPITHDVIEDGSWCAITFEENVEMIFALFQISTFTFFLTPMLILTILYLLIGVKIHRKTSTDRRPPTGSARNGGSTARLVGEVKVKGEGECEAKGSCRDQGQIKSRPNRRRKGEEIRSHQAVPSRRSVLRVLVAVVIAFFICWAPFHAQRLLFVYITQKNGWTEDYKVANAYLYMLGGCFYYTNSTINPILYNVLSRRFRRAFRDTICRPCRGGQSDYRSDRKWNPAFSGQRLQHRSLVARYTGGSVSLSNGSLGFSSASIATPEVQPLKILCTPKTQTEPPRNQTEPPRNQTEPLRNQSETLIHRPDPPRNPEDSCRQTGD